jgi:hypothetical protein
MFVALQGIGGKGRGMNHNFRLMLINCSPSIAEAISSLYHVPFLDATATIGHIYKYMADAMDMSTSRGSL